MSDKTVDDDKPEEAADAAAEAEEAPPRAEQETPETASAEEAAAPEESSEAVPAQGDAGEEESPVASGEAAEAGAAEAGAAEGGSPEAASAEAVAAEAGAAEAGAAGAETTEGGGGEARYDKLKKAEEILRSSAPSSQREEIEDAFEKVVHINRVAKVVKGGRRFSFSALVVSGDRDGHVGFGFGKAQEVAECIKKASEASKKSMISVNITENTIPHPVVGEHGGGRVMLRPASPGTGLIAGGGVRAVVEAAGVKDVLAKSLGSNNHANVIKATLNALEQLRTKEQIYSLRGKRQPDRKAL